MKALYCSFEAAIKMSLSTRCNMPEVGGILSAKITSNLALIYEYVIRTAIKTNI
jgi:hypothetical protein